MRISQLCKWSILIIFESVNHTYSTAYIIGGLVDHNRYKFATLNKAKEEGLTVKRLPISQHVSLKSSTILSVNCGKT